MSERPLTVNEAADFLQTTPWIVRRYINRGILKAYKLGDGSAAKGKGHWRIWKQDLMAFINKSSNVK